VLGLRTTAGAAERREEGVRVLTERTTCVLLAEVTRLGARLALRLETVGLGELARLAVLAVLVGLLRRLTAGDELLRLDRLALDVLRDGLDARRAAAG
jgi:uncharacterized metal-binding protein